MGAGRFAEWYERAQIARVRRAYVGVSGLPSPDTGLAGMVDEMRRGLAELSDDRRARADDAVFEAIFMGRFGIAVLRAAASAAPQRVARLAATLSPRALSFLIGPAERVGPADDVIPRCRFRERGGAVLCEQVCRRPTEQFCRERLRLPLALEPDPGSLACRWRWGAR